MCYFSDPQDKDVARLQDFQELEVVLERAESLSLLAGEGQGQPDRQTMLQHESLQADLLGCGVCSHLTQLVHYGHGGGRPGVL